MASIMCQLFKTWLFLWRKPPSLACSIRMRKICSTSVRTSRRLLGSYGILQGGWMLRYEFSYSLKISELMWHRINPSNCSVHLRRCCAKDRPIRLRTRWRKCKDINLLSKRNLMASACSCTSAEMNTSTVRGRICHVYQWPELTLDLGKEKIILTCTDSMSGRAV